MGEQNTPEEQNAPGEQNTPGENSTPQPARKPAAVVVPLLGLIAVIVGVIVAWTNQSTDFGWFAYAPLSNTMFIGDNGSFVSKETQLGLAVTVLGLLVLAFWAGLRIGRRR
ncbi:hypothetical protein CQ020_10675 [Arthrobacter sp. MYb23]|uniref:DUF1388 domain-containing protein n=1 Tax=unclassified Arthrobacter TaxID=235627 RepID=UPI000CFE2325|nr:MULTISPECIES: DUF1388 domain-containing protein [unclassified Arthrobacter]PRB41690.1 hypothetical protein CQ038_13095 [Arthrobacter sp. MYb51]PRB95959.1 hypothetical protein CQ020_10675 [Arthrobacter sp. MYb23]